MSIKLATGAAIDPAALCFPLTFSITDYGASPSADPVTNTRAINAAISAASEQGGGTILFPAGTFLIYTILLKSNIHLLLDPGTVLAAARTEIRHS